MDDVTEDSVGSFLVLEDSNYVTKAWIDRDRVRDGLHRAGGCQ
jgi:hypothetical protein